MGAQWLGPKARVRHRKQLLVKCRLKVQAWRETIPPLSADDISARHREQKLPLSFLFARMELCGFLLLLNFRPARPLRSGNLLSGRRGHASFASVHGGKLALCR